MAAPTWCRQAFDAPRFAEKPAAKAMLGADVYDCSAPSTQFLCVAQASTCAPSLRRARTLHRPDRSPPPRIRTNASHVLQRVDSEPWSPYKSLARRADQFHTPEDLLPTEFLPSRSKPAKHLLAALPTHSARRGFQIGRAACRDRGEVSGHVGTL